MTLGDRSLSAAALEPVRERDIRIDFFCGIALISIFIDHIPGNALAKYTLPNFGFADASEIFVLLAGYAAFLAYSRAFYKGWAAGLAKVVLRVRDLYVAHLLVFIVCVMGLAIAARVLRNPAFSQLNLVPFNSDPIGSIGRALVLLYQPAYFNILPLYVMLLMWLPVLLWLMRANVVLALLASATLWATTGVLHCNLPSYTSASGWEFDPFAWQLLFSLGTISAHLSTTGQHVRSRSSSWLLCISMAYLVFACIVAAPWTGLPSLHEARLLADFRVDISKQYLSAWRLAHIAALGYMATYLVSPRALWLTRTWAGLIINCGQHSLPIFGLCIVLSLTAYVILQANHSLLLQIAVNIGGVALLGLTAQQLAQQKQARTHAVRIQLNASPKKPARAPKRSATAQ
jgi:hypothetical protein